MNMQAAIRKVVHGVRKRRTGIKRQYDTLYRDGLLMANMFAKHSGINQWRLFLQLNHYVFQQ